MRYMGFAVIFMLAALFMDGSSIASADTISVSHKITIRAKVLPAQYIIVDKHNNILEISSNSTEQAVPQVFKNKIEEANKVPLTSQIYDKYKHLVLDGDLKAGTLYKNTPKPLQRSALTFSLILHP